MSEVQIERERKNPVHSALVLLLTHLQISQPEASKEAGKICGQLDDHFAPEKEWQQGITEEQVNAIVDAKIAATSRTGKKGEN